jgi:Probable Zinc-ribbon domain
MQKSYRLEIEDVIEPFRRRHMILLVDKDAGVAAEWCYKRNCGWGPEDFSHASSVRAWWLCPICHREYKAKICQRTALQSACPYCASKRVCEDNSLAVLYPAVSREWHPTKNGRLRPSDVTYATNKKVWWVCAGKHVWRASISTRTTQNACCPYCYERRLEEARKRPRVRNRRNIVLSPGKKISRAWYEQWDFEPLSETHPNLVTQWHPTKNGQWTPKDFTRGSEVKAWWQCEAGPDHEWQSSIYSRTGKSRRGCPYCAGQRASITNSLTSLFPMLAAEWDKRKNGTVGPKDVTAHSNKKAWWRCQHGHSWQAIIGNRTNRLSPCPACKARQKNWDQIQE